MDATRNADGESINPANPDLAKTVEGELSKSTRELSDVLDRYLSAWFIAGLVLMFAAQKSVVVTVGGVGINLFPPDSAPVQIILTTFGILLSLAVAYRYVFLKRGQSKILSLSFVSLGVAACVLLGSEYYREYSNQSRLDKWGFEVKDDKFSLTFTPEPLRQFVGDSMLCVFRPWDPKNPVDDSSTDVFISATRSVDNILRSQEFTTYWDTGDIGKQDIGKGIECVPVIIPNGVNYSGAKSLKDLLSVGAKLFIQRDSPPSGMISIDSYDPEEISKGFEHIHDENSRLAAVRAALTTITNDDRKKLAKEHSGD
jgi:hypothetical protein